uniref:Cytochrome c biogenesis F n=1 Tax=Welwitschia mirabilis TaxID=3377 RepID=A0A0X9SPQ8_WELMI|nr:cytochrome c biogenesis F [Welwitschia mirabilis]AMA21010.1 cytochrome c biogenesis F [Welwitschia mirabilis]QXE44341.1 cytochrome c biogenesis F [Welwitschia mirabilis]
MVQLQNLFFFITSMVVLCGTAAPVLLKWFVGRDVFIGAPFFVGTIIPILTSILPSLVYNHGRGFIRSMDKAKSLVLVGASRPILLPDSNRISSPVHRRAFSGRVVRAPLSITLALPLLVRAFIALPSYEVSILVQHCVFMRGFMRDLSYSDCFCGVLCLLCYSTLFLPYEYGRNRAKTLLLIKRLCSYYTPPNPKGVSRVQGLRPQPLYYKSSVCSPFTPPQFVDGSVWPTYITGAQVSEFGPSPSPRSAQVIIGPSGGEGVPDYDYDYYITGGGLERCLALPTSRLHQAVGHGVYRSAPMKMKMHLSHGGVCIFIMGVICYNSTDKIQFTQRLPLGSELHMGKELCCLRGLDHSHGPTFHSICGNILIYKPSNTLCPAAWFDHDESLRTILLAIRRLCGGSGVPPVQGSYENGKQLCYMHRFRSWWIHTREHDCFWLTMFPEKRYFFSIQASTTKAAQHTNLFTDPYAPIGTGSNETGGWYTTIMKLPFISCIRIGFLLASPGGLCSLLCQLQKDKLHRNR